MIAEVLVSAPEAAAAEPAPAETEPDDAKTDGEHTIEDMQPSGGCPSALSIPMSTPLYIVHRHVHTHVHTHVCPPPCPSPCPSSCSLLLCAELLNSIYIGRHFTHTAPVQEQVSCHRQAMSGEESQTTDRASRLNYPGDLPPSRRPEHRRKKVCEQNYKQIVTGKWLRVRAWAAYHYDGDQLKEFDDFESAFAYEESCRINDSGGRHAMYTSKPESNIPQQQLHLFKHTRHVICKDGNKTRVQMEELLEEMHERFDALNKDDLIPAEHLAQ